MAEPSYVESLLVRVDGVRRRAFPHAVEPHREAGKNIAMLIEPGLELGLAFTDAADDRLLHTRALR